MSDEIKPALTAEEWAEAGRYGIETIESAWGGHAVAALCLYGQPFGFTRHDVEELRAISVEYANEFAGGAETKYGPLEDIAARIEALLPPEEDDGR